MSNSTPPNEIERFIALVLSSGLVDEQQLNAALRDLKLSHVDPSLPELCRHLAAHDLLSEWQISKLREGKYKGFFLDEYRILSHIVTRTAYSAYMATHTETGRKVALLITPWQFTRSNKIEYRVVDPSEA